MQDALANLGHYNSAKHGLVGLMRTMALELGPHRDPQRQRGGSVRGSRRCKFVLVAG